VDHRSRIEQQVGDFYASGMDETAIEAAGITPLRPELDRLAKIATIADVQAAIARLHRIRVNAGFFFTSEQDPKNSVMMIATGGQAGLGLPDRDYYFRDDDKSKLLRSNMWPTWRGCLNWRGICPRRRKRKPGGDETRNCSRPGFEDGGGSARPRCQLPQDAPGGSAEADPAF